MRVIMMGTGTFAEPTLEALLASPHPVVGLVTQPDRDGPLPGNPPLVVEGKVSRPPPPAPRSRAAADGLASPAQPPLTFRHAGTPVAGRRAQRPSMTSP